MNGNDGVDNDEELEGVRVRGWIGESGWDI